MIPESTLNQIQDRLDIVEIISGFAALKRSGRNFKALCPFHQEKTPSFMVNPDKQIFHCFGCGTGGNVFSFLMKAEKKDFLEVVETLAERVGVEIPTDRIVNSEAVERASLLAKANGFAMDFYHEALLKKKEAEAAREYLKSRGLTTQTLSDFKIGFALESWDALCRAFEGKVPDAVVERAGLSLSKKDGGFYDRFRNRIIFPILDAKGVCVAFGGRVLDDSLPKYLNSPETEIYSKGRNLYGLFQARKPIRDSDAVIVVEGYMDLVACHQAGVKNVVASLGTALTPEQVRLVKRHTKNILMLYDADPAGESATLRGLEICLEEGLDVKIVRLASGHDPDSFIRKFGVEGFRRELAGAKTLFEYKFALLKNKFDADTLEGKVKIANEMVVLFSKVQNEILKNAWMKELSRDLGLSEEALRAELNKNGPRTRELRPAASVPSKNDVSAAEKLLIGLLMDGPEYVSKAKQQVDSKDFQHPKARAIARQFLEGGEEPMPAAQLVNFYKDDAESVRLISQASAEMDVVLDKEKVFRDCLLWLKRSRVLVERAGLQLMIAQAQEQGDRGRIDGLLRDLNELNKGIQKINEKN